MNRMQRTCYMYRLVLCRRQESRIKIGSWTIGLTCSEWHHRGFSKSWSTGRTHAREILIEELPPIIMITDYAVARVFLREGP